MNQLFVKKSEKIKPIAIQLILEKEWPVTLKKLPPAHQQWIKTIGFQAKSGKVCLLPNKAGEVDQVLLGLRDAHDFWSVGALPAALPEGIYQIVLSAKMPCPDAMALAFGLGAYQFNRYRAPTKNICAQLVWPEPCDQKRVESWIQTIRLARDWINTPTENFGPAELAEALKETAEAFSADFSQIVGDQLLKKNYPLIHAVGRAAATPPRLLDLVWGNPKHPKITLVGKGVCYDTGGLSIKTTDNMKSMKKDMAGAAEVIALARLIMAARWPVRLRVLIPAVENAVSGNSYRPGDVLKARNGLSIEVLDTDAEGRLILADALSEASTENPDFLVDFSTLTGAQRVALGTDIPGYFTTDDSFSNSLLQMGKAHGDCVWPLPLHDEYASALHSDIADLANVGNRPYAGAIVAALFLKRFVSEKSVWCHFDFMGFNLQTRPGRPKGGDVQGLFAIFYALKQAVETRFIASQKVRMARN